jgi:Tfp pilus assembly protein PilX
MKHTNSPSNSQRRGSIYVIVLATMSVGMLVVSAGLLAARVHAGRAAALADADRATRLAEAGLGAALKKIETTTAWRSGATDPFESIPFGDDKVKVRLTDPADANVTDDATETIEIQSVATVGGARRIVSVRATPVVQAEAAMSYAILAQGAISFTGTSTFWAELPIHSNASVSTALSTVEATVTAVGTVTGTGYTPAGSGGATAVTMPLMASVIAEYEAIGSSGPLGGSGPQTYSNLLISPANAPGTLSTNASGVYVMDCGGKRLTLSNCRINGTLVLKNATAGVRVTSNVTWDPAVAGYPALIVDGVLTITVDGSDLSEANQNVNYNPIGAAYEGSADSDKTDVYACEIRGLVYASGNVTMSGAVSLAGPLIVGGTLTTNGETAVLRGVVPSSGPPGFRKTSTLLVDRSTWTRVVE